MEFKGNAIVYLLIFLLPPLSLIPLFQEKRLCAHPFLEIYRDGQIHFMAPLARQDHFYVPEVRRVERRPLAKEDLHSDSDVSGIIFKLSCRWNRFCRPEAVLETVSVTISGILRMDITYTNTLVMFNNVLW